MAESVYIHVPFCKSKCNYCSFISFSSLDLIEEYIQSLLKEIDYYYQGESLKTLYFGGGTPSLLQIGHVKNIISKFKLDKNCEVTFELNPDDITEYYLKELSAIGINRISIGSQTFDDNILKLIGRRHDSNAIITSINLAKKVGFNNINLDLIYGLPSQKMNNIKYDIDNILELDIPHISTYGLKIDENSLWSKNLPNNLPNDDLQADMYEFINSELEKNGYSRYEISNFSKNGFESKHNLNYWNNLEYYGFGISAHGYVDGIRYSNFLNFNNYFTNPIKHELEHIVSREEKIQEEIFLGFRKANGININSFKNKFDIDFENEYSDVLKKYVPDYIEQTNYGYRLTLQGVLLSNIILAEFI